MSNEMQRVIIPSEFYDITSPMLLTAPIPQFPHAKLVISALNAALKDTGEAIAMPIAGRDVPKGAFDEYAVLKDLELMMSNPLPGEAIQIINDFRPEAKTPGHVVRFNRPRFVDTTHTAISRTVAAGTLISTTPVPILGDQVAIAIKRFAGPYNGATPGPYAIDFNDAARSLHSFTKIVDAHFKYDYHKCLDTWAIALFDQAPTANIVYAGGATADNDMSAENSHPFDWRLLKRTARKMDDANIPRMKDGKRIVCITPLQEEQLTTDPEYQRLAKTRDDMNPLFKDSYVTGIMDWHIFKSNTLTRVANSSSVNVHYAQAFGPGAVGWGLGDQPKIMPNSNDNYGQTVFAIWLAFMGFGVLNENFLYSLRSS